MCSKQSSRADLSVDRFEVIAASQKILDDEKVLEAVRQLKLPDDVIVACDPWMYGADRDSDEGTDHKPFRRKRGGDACMMA